MSLDNLPFNAFDLLLVLVLLVSLIRGRKAGMSGEVFSLMTWLVILFGCAVAYEPVGQLFMQSTGLFSLLSSYLIAYIGLAIVVVLLFAALKRAAGDRFVGGDTFGNAEYFLGMGSGVVRGACIILVALALLNARFYSTMEVRAMEKFQNDVYGSNFFPTLQSVQATVFQKSLTGPWLREYLGFLFIKPTTPTEVKIERKEAGVLQ